MSNPTRDRRRRVLNEEVMGAADLLSVTEEAPVEGSRYTDAAGVENHPQVTDFIPRRVRTYVGLMLAGLGSIALLAVLHNQSAVIASALHSQSISAFDLQSPGNLGSLLSGAMLAVCTLLSLLVYSLRRHRVNDYRAHYRVWLWVTIGCAALTVASVTQLHHVWCQAITALTGWGALEGNAVWWIIPVSLIGLLVANRLVREVAERPFSLTMLLCAIVCYTLSVVSQNMSLVETLAPHSVLVSAISNLLGHLFLLTSMTWYTRYVILDVQGLIEHSHLEEQKAEHSIEEKQSAKKSSMSRKASVQKKETVVKETLPFSQQELATSSKIARKSAKQKSDSFQQEAESLWVDGSDGSYEDEYDEGGSNRKMNKAERKRLRKQKANARRAA